jgi:diguanylate cyclase (GGDEF)-like protein
MPVSGLWLTGWVMIALHFTAFIFMPLPGIWGPLAAILCTASIAWAGLLFMAASSPFRRQAASLCMMAALAVTYTLYISLLIISPVPLWLLDLAAVLFGAMPLAIMLVAMRTFKSTLCWSTVCVYCALSIFLLVFQHRPGNDASLAADAVLFTVYLSCCIYFLYGQRLITTGALITFAGFLAWASVFIVSPWTSIYLPHLPLETEVWNLPKYVVAVGMILLLLENQIEHNKYLALHDELTKLPNRRLFQDRLAGALERARRSGAHTALLLIDLDRFKQVNDSLGHHAGDLLLQHVATVLAGYVRRTDTVARTGGDEFSIILEEPTNREDAERVSRSLMQLLKQPLNLGDHSVQIGASVGIAIFPEDATSVEPLCIKADLRMYAEKQIARDELPIEPSRPANSASYPEVEVDPKFQFVKSTQPIHSS